MNDTDKFVGEERSVTGDRLQEGLGKRQERQMCTDYIVTFQVLRYSVCNLKLLGAFTQSGESIRCTFG